MSPATSSALAPGVYFEAAETGRRRIAPLRTDVAGFVGLAERGPLDRAVRIESLEQFHTVFGGFELGSFLPYAAKAFFDNGGARAWFVRVAGDPLETESAPLAVPAADGSYSAVRSVEGFVAGAVVTVEQGGGRFNHRLAGVDPLRRRLLWERPLEPELDALLPMSFAAGPASAFAETLDPAGAPSLRLHAASPGGWGNRLRLRLNVTTPAATRTRAVPQPLDRSTSFVETVVGFSTGTLVRLFQSGAAGRRAHRIVTAVDPVRRLLTWDRPLEPAFQPGAAGAPPLSLETLELGLSVALGGELVELFEGLSLVPAHPGYIERAVLESLHVRILDLQPDAGDAERLAARLPGAGGLDLELRGGRDGIAALTWRHLTGDPGSETRRGLRALEEIDEVAMVAIPDALVRPRPPVLHAPQPVPEPDPCDPCPPAVEPPPGALLGPVLAERLPELSLEDVFAVQEAMVEHCETLRDRVAILDPPLVASAEAAAGEIQAWRSRFDTSFAALYHPWIVVYDQTQPRGALVREVPPSGHVAGLYARTDLAVGVHKAPANEALRWVQAPLLAIGAEEQGFLNPLGVNCIRTFAGRGIRVYGARTLSSDSQWRYVPVRRLLLAIEEAVQEAMAWAVFEPNDVTLRQTVRLSISSYLRGLWTRGALAGSTPAEAFFVRCDAENNPQEAVDEGRLIADVGVAPVVPAEFVIFRIGRIAEAFEIEETGGSR